MWRSVFGLFSSEAIFNAAYVGDIAKVKALVSSGVSVNSRAWDGWTPLHWASWNGHLAVVQYLMEQGADINVQDKLGWTPLLRACEKGHLAVVQYLMEQGADINAKNNDGQTPLHMACGNGHLTVVQYLMEQGADINAKNNVGQTPLHMACGNGHLAVVQYLMEQGADINAKNNSGRTALDVSRNGRIKALLRGATVSQACAGVPLETSSRSSATTMYTHQQLAPPSSQQHPSAISSGVATATSGDKQSPCAFFAVGKCVFGSQCRFLHISPTPDSMPVAVAAPQSILADPPPQQAPVAFTADSNRIVSAGRTEDGHLRGMLFGMFPADLPLLTLLNSLTPIMVSHPDIDIARQVKLAEKKAVQLAAKYGGTLSSQERAAIVLYTMEAFPRETSVYYMVNAALRKVDRQAVRPWRDYIWLLLHALRKLPAIAMDTNLYRGMKVSMSDLGDAYARGSEFQWAGFSSTSLRVDVMSEDFLGRSGSRVLFNLKLIEPVGRNISDFSLYQEAEILLPPNMLFEVKGVLDAGNDLYILQCEQMASLDMLLDFRN